VARERLHREEVAAIGWLPLTIGCKHITWYQTVRVHVPDQGMAPGVQHGTRHQQTTETFGVAPEGLEGVPGAAL
jgi:hypothetical protein